MKNGSYAMHAEIWGLGGPDRSEEIKFYVSLIGEYGEKVLCPMCADGEIAAGLAEKGFTVSAFDIQPEMIQAAKKKHPVSGNLHFSIADITGFNFPEKDFNSCIIGTGDLHHISSESEVVRALECIYGHLDSRSCLLLELHYPSNESWDFPIREFTMLDEPEKRRKIWKTSQSSYDAQLMRQYIKQQIFIERNGVTESFIHELELQLISRDDLKKMLKQTGFVIRDEIGDFNCSKWQKDAEKWLVVIEKSA